MSPTKVKCTQLLLVWCYVISAFTIPSINTEVYTSLAEMEEIFETESVLIQNFEGFIKMERDKLNYLQNKITEYQREHNDASSDITSYVSNPVNAYLLTKRLTMDWRQLENLISDDVGNKLFLTHITNLRNVMKFPSDEDLNGAAVALMRLQDTYELDTASVARGELNGIKYSTEMSSDDCFELGRQSYENYDYYHTVLWMKEAMTRLLQEPRNQTQTITKAHILDYLAFSTYQQEFHKAVKSEFLPTRAPKYSHRPYGPHQRNFDPTIKVGPLEVPFFGGLTMANPPPPTTPINWGADLMATILLYLVEFGENLFAGNIESAMTMTNELLELSPENERANRNKLLYEKEIAQIKEDKKVNGDDGSENTLISDLSIAKADPAVLNFPEHETYIKLCRGELAPMPAELRLLRCRFVTNNVPFLKIAPLKLEEVFLDPYLVIYHEVIYDSEIELFKKLALPRFNRATVLNAVNGGADVVNYRISKSSRLKTEEHPKIADIAQRTSDMTGLDMRSAENLQVANYGIGGHYAPHFDFAIREETNIFEAEGNGNRIATALFYMSDVEQGGATVFTEIHRAIFPQKGSAVFWWNLHRFGDGDFRTRHAACPVLTGSKWVSTLWIHEAHQEFRRPCLLEPDHSEFAI